MPQPTSRRTRIERSFDAAAVRQLKASSRTGLTIGGAELAGLGLRAGVVDELQLFLVPVAVGDGKPALPLGLRLDLDLRDEVHFASGVVYLRYTVGTVQP